MTNVRTGPSEAGLRGDSRGSAIFIYIKEPAAIFLFEVNVNRMQPKVPLK